MTSHEPILILAPAPQKGDLFGRLVADLFLALGYSEPRLNIHKTGREIDVQARHRTEPRSVRAECKATTKPIGGDQINKFVGALERERRRCPDEQITGYFISLAGFTQSAWEQELEGDDPRRLTLLDGEQLIGELIAGRIIVPRERALERAGRCAAVGLTQGLTPEERPQLLGHEIGWVWAVRFRRNREVTHLALIHADGEALSAVLARQVLEEDRRVEGSLHLLSYLPPELVPDQKRSLIAEARKAYLSFLAAECGDIELEGLPADQEIGSRRLRLENIFVPLRLLPAPSGDREGSTPGTLEDTAVESRSVGETLAAYTRLAILALPGAGKTTLIKRLAIAYAFPERRADLGDHLPDREWFPLLMRCRQLRGRTGEPITRLLGELAHRAELGELADAFRELVQTVLREGHVLLLIDGLDEIADAGERAGFVTQLCTFLSTYPRVDIILTSREAGFRPVAGVLAGHCTHFRIAEFKREDIERLTLAWHREVVGHRPGVDKQARELAAAIWSADRVRRLAVNPLLLTTLLLVNRWVGQLPNRRTILYDKAIEVLLWTWNVQGHAQLDLQEVVPQLAFLAWHMMDQGTQRISRPQLRETLQAARKQMPDVLAHASLTVDELVERVEGRSSLLILTGYEIDNGCLVQVYEFQHLTFQEFLAAKALVEGYYPDQSPSDSLVSKLECHFEDAAWKEVIPLAAVLSGRKAAPLMAKLVEMREESPTSESVLGQCLLDDVQVGPDLLERALLRVSRYRHNDSLVYQIASGKYGQVLRDLVWKDYCDGNGDLFTLGSSFRVAGYAGLGWSDAFEFDPEIAEKADSLARSKEPRERALGLLSLMLLSCRIATISDRSFVPGSAIKWLGCWEPVAIAALNSDERWEQFSGAWVLIWLAQAGEQRLPSVMVIQRLLDLILVGTPDLINICAWALSVLHPPPSRTKFMVRSTERYEAMASMLESCRIEEERFGLFFAAFYWGQHWTDSELSGRLEKLIRDNGILRHNRLLQTNLRTILHQLGTPARKALEALQDLLASSEVRVNAAPFVRNVLK